MLSFALLGCAQIACAQTDQRTFSPYGQIYRLTDAEAVTLLRDEKAPAFRESWLHTLVDTFQGAEPRRPLPPGHYLLAEAVEEQIELEVRTVQTIQVWLLPNSRDFTLTVHDSTGMPIRDARVLLRGKQAPFDTALQCYRLPRRSRNGFVEVYAAGESWFGRLDNQYSKPLWRRRLNYWGSFGAGKIVAVPVRWGRVTVYKTKTLIREGYWQRSYRRYGEADFPGYIAFSQPKYQPGDTLRVKAYVAGRKGRPWRQPLELDIREQGGTYRTVLRRDVKPLTPGAFVFEMPLGDTLRLDLKYGVTFSEKRRKGNRSPRYISESFTLEDYQLDEVTYTLAPAQKEFRRGEPAVLRASARDANDLPVPDANLRLVLLTENIKDFHAAELYVPDTLWQHEQAFSTDTETAIAIPDSIWPEADLRVSAHAYCTTGSGELQEKKTTFTALRRQNPINAWLEGGFLRVERAPTYPFPDTALLLETQPNGRVVNTRRILLPFRERLLPGVWQYTVSAGTQTLDIPVPDADDAVKNTAFQTGDSVFFALVNPHRADIRFQVYEGAQKIGEGAMSDSLWYWQRPVRPGRSYRLSWQFVWAGRPRQYDAEALFYKNLLNIQLDQPALVQPGEQVQVKIKVEDAQKRPVRGANLTAGAYNRQFGDKTPYSAPVVSYRGMRRSFAFNKFGLEKIGKNTLSTPVNRTWYDWLQLDSVLYYRLRYRGDGSYTEVQSIRKQVRDTAANTPEGLPWGMPLESDSFYQQRPQFAPYIIRGNQAQPVYLIWCNSRLVYYSGATNQPRYSFYGWYGYNQIKIRTRDGEYTLDSVYLNAGQKLEIALDADRFTQAKTPFKIRFEKRPDTLTLFERQTLQRTMLLWRPDTKQGGHYFWNGPENIQVVSNQAAHSLHISGPFYPNETLYYLNSGKFFTSFSFEPGFEYSIVAGRERLYNSSWPKGATRLPANTLARHPGDLAWGPHHIVVQSKQPPALLPYKWSGRDQPGKASLQLRLARTDTLLAIALAGDTLYGPYRPGSARIDELLPGNYHLFVFSAGGYVWSRDIRLFRDSLLFIDASAVPFRPAGATESFEHFFSNATDVSQQSTGKNPSQFSQWPGNTAGSNGIRGVLTDNQGEALIGASVIFWQAGVRVGGVLTDVDGVYQRFLPPGTYDIEYQYTGYNTSRISGVTIGNNTLVSVDQQLESGALLHEVVVVAYRVPLIEQDHTSAGKTLTADEIRRLPTRNVNALGAGASGMAIDGKNRLHLKGSRSNNLEYYVDGVRTADGLAGEAAQDELMPGGEPALRTQFRDQAYWQPNLITDENGEAWFRVTFPENITSWNSFVLGMDRRKRAGMLTQNTRAYKPLLAKLSLPRFAVAGDRFDAAGLTTNLSGDSVEVRTAFRLDGQLLHEQRARIGEALVEFATVQAPSAGADSLYLSYEMSSQTASDGEKRGIAILPLGTRETAGQFLLLERDSALTLSFDPALGPVTVQVQDNALDLLSEDIRYLRDYPYGCNEQNAGRLYALLAEQQIATARQKSATQNPKTAAGAKAFLEKEIARCLKRLQDGQLADGSWGWWAGGTPNAWMTIYVLRALREAKTAGYNSPGYQNGLTWLRHETPGLPLTEQREALLFLRESDVNFDCTPFFTRLDTLPRSSLHERLSHWRLQQLCGQKLSIDSLQKTMNPTTTGGLYCGDENNHWYDRRANNTLLAYDIAYAAGWTDITRGIRRYWLENRPAARQRNTIETAQMLRRLLPELLAGADTLRANRLEINSIVCDTFPIKRILPGSISSVSLRKSGDTPLYASIYQQWQNAAPAPRNDLFEIKSWLEQGGRRVDSLRRGEPAEMVVAVQVLQAADYVMLEAPIPAGCSYGEKKPFHRPETHREYFRDRTAIFFETLPVGRYEFRIPLEPRFSGQFTLNPVRVEQMYFPVFFGRNGGEIVIIRH
jgi:hypothetical protein